MKPVILWIVYMFYCYIAYVTVEKKINHYFYMAKLVVILLFGLCCNVLIIRKYCNNNINRNHFVPPGTIYDRNNLLLSYTYTNSIINIKYKELIKKYGTIEKSPLSESNIDLKNIHKYIKGNTIELKYKNNSFYKWSRKISSSMLDINSKLHRKYILGNLTSGLGYCNIHNGKILGIEKLALNGDVYSTIDIKLQVLLANAINNNNNTNAKCLWGIIINLKGEIEAMHYNTAPDIFQKNPKIVPHPILFSSYEFGSMAKIITIFSAIENGVCNEQSLFPNPHIIAIPDRIISNPIKYNKPEVSVYEMIQYSLNTPTIYIAKQLKYDLLTTINQMHLFDSIDLGGIQTASGHLPKKVRLVDIISMSFGYAYAVNPMNFLRIVAALFSNGKVYNGSIVKNHSKQILQLDSEMCERMRKLFIISHKDKLLSRLSCPFKTGTVIVKKQPEKIYNTFIVVGITNTNNQVVKIMMLGALNTKYGSTKLRIMANDIIRKMNIMF